MRGMALLLVLAVFYVVVRWLLRQPQRAQVRIGASAIGLVLVSLAATGRLPWVFGLFGALLPLLAGLLSPRRRGDRQAAGPSPGGQSVVETHFLRMTLDHQSGEMMGQVLTGRFAGQRLDELSQDQLRTLLFDYDSDDHESAALLRAYLERTFGAEWQEAEPERREFDGLSGEMSQEEAYAILGLDAGASEEAIIEAHGRLIQRLHPDRGGSTFLAAKINQARDLLTAR
jgi:hypothetical protein